MGYHRRVFVFASTTVWQEESEYATRKNELTLRYLSADRLRWPSHLAAGISDTGSTATASGRFSIGQLVGVQLRTRGNALPDLPNRGYREPV